MVTRQQSDRHPATSDALEELEKDLKIYLDRIERWVDLSPYEKYFGRFREIVGRAYPFVADTESDLPRYRRAALARIVFLFSFLVAAMFAPMFYDYLPLAGAYGLATIIGVVLVLWGVAAKPVFATMAVLDVALVTFTIHLFGSLTSVIVVFYPLLVTLATIFLGFFWGLLYAALCSGSYLVVVALEYFGYLSYSPILGHELPAYEVHGFPTFPIAVLIAAHIINYGCAFWTGLLTYEIEIRRRGAQSAVRAKNEMLAICSHDLKNLLVSVGGYSELLVMELQGQGKEAEHHAREIQASSQRMLELIRNLLDAARLEGGAVPLVRSRFTYRELIDDISKTQRANAQLYGLLLEFPSPSSSVLFDADRSKITQVFTNLIQNALIYTPHGGQVTMELAALHGSRARIAVRDTGPGISKDTQAILFDTLALARQRKERKGKLGNALSTGLGLSVVKRFVEMHGGQVWVESEPGKGSTFWVELPVAPPPTTPVGSPSNHP